MLDVPKKVNVLGIAYTVTEGYLADADGCIEPSKQRIVLSEEMSREKKEQVFLHELIHGILDQLGYSDECGDEKLVQGLAIGLHQALFS